MTRIQNYFHKFIQNPRVEVLSGLTVAIALVPEAIAFALIAGVSPLVGMYAAFIVCLITSLFGGRTGMISGATGALAVVMVSLVSTHGVEYLFATVVLMGIFQMLAGVFHLGRFIKMVPHPVMIGFVNGLAIVIFLAQLNQFKITDAIENQTWASGQMLYTMLGIIAFTMAIAYLFPRATKKVPSALVAIVSSTVVVIALGIKTKTVG
ncbi:MAG: SulP family inorganic anion transporter, partial [Proteobacteria bacterium]|nr:SulP family inorganic anion transporter [Pseudomonadota bacterium]